MLTLTDTLLAHQRGRRRKPTLAVTAYAQRFGVPYFPLAVNSSYGATDAPTDMTFNASSLNLRRVRNNAGSLDRGSGFGSSWTNLDTVTAGQGFALRYDSTNSLYTLVYGDGNDLKIRTSSDGVTWSGSTVLVTEASAIGAVALAIDSGGDACAFYTLGTTTTLKRLRRTTGTWAGAGTTWSKTGSVASLTGLSAIWDADYYLVVTGTEVTTTDERVWSFAMGDTSLPTNAWSDPVAIAEADADASITFHHPHIAQDPDSGATFVTFQQDEAGDVVYSRTMLSSTNAAHDRLAPWREPYPIETDTEYGAALTITDYYGDGSAVVMNAFSPKTKLEGSHGSGWDLSSRVLSCSWRETPSSLRVRVELDNADGLADGAGGDTPVLYSLLRVGYDLVIQHGMMSDTTNTPPTAEFGTYLRCNIDRIEDRYVSGKRTMLIEASGPWEQLARYRAPQAWTAPDTTTRGAIFQRIAGKAGLTVAEANSDLTPTDFWSTNAPPFAIALGETAAATLRRLFAHSRDMLRIEAAAGGLQICGVDWLDGNALDDGLYGKFGFPDDQHGDANYPDPFTSFTRIRQRETNWVRVEGADRYTDKFIHLDRDGYAWLQDHVQPTEPIFDLIRDLDADDDTKTEDAALAALERSLHLTPQAEVVAQLHTGVELYDLAFVHFVSPPGPPYLSTVTEPGYYRVIGRGVDYARGPGASGEAVANSVLTLGRGFYTPPL